MTETAPDQYGRLDRDELAFIEEITAELRLSRQNHRRLLDAAVDLSLWEQPPLRELWDASGSGHLTGKTKSQFLLRRLFARIDELRNRPVDYTDFIPPKIERKREVSIEEQQPRDTILGSCPVAGEKTRCCGLQTLDAVMQCGFACSYCSIQSFYDEDRVYFHGHLAEKLSRLELDPGRIYHIGTGQSSDSLMWGDRSSLLTDLFAFAAEHPNVLLELKSKSARTDWITDLHVPPNVIATWSLNTPTVIEAEEHLTASLRSRLHAARSAADAGIPVGFHLHPMVLHTGWREEYGELIDTIEQMFSPREVVMISLGTLTFIRPVIRRLRESGRKTRITQMPLHDAAGKLSYPLKQKEELFSFAYRRFSRSWRDSVFFYLCMEDASLWEPVFGRSYPDNDTFEEAMKQAYMEKVRAIADKNSHSCLTAGFSL